MTLEIGVFGCGTIGRAVVTAVGEGTVDDARLTAVYDRNPERVVAALQSAGIDESAAVDHPSVLQDRCDVVVECAGHGAVTAHAEAILKAGTHLMLLSVGALADHGLYDRLRAVADRNDARLLVPSGAIAGLDGIKAAAASNVLDEVIFTTRKPPQGLAGAPYIVENDIDLDTLTEATLVFEGTAREAAPAFPANINVAMALSLAGLGPDETVVKIVADPDEVNNVHIIEATGAAGPMRFAVDTVPHPDNPKTSYLAALSTVASLRRLTETVTVGT